MQSLLSIGVKWIFRLKRSTKFSLPNFAVTYLSSTRLKILIKCHSTKSSSHMLPFQAQSSNRCTSIQSKLSTTTSNNSNSSICSLSITNKCSNKCSKHSSNNTICKTSTASKKTMMSGTDIIMNNKNTPTRESSSTTWLMRSYPFKCWIRWIWTRDLLSLCREWSRTKKNTLRKTTSKTTVPLKMSSMSDCTN